MSDASTTSDPLPTARRLTLSRTGRVTVVGFANGLADGNALRELYEQVALLTDDRNLRLIVDFEGVDMASSGAMGMMVTIKKKCMSAGGKMSVVIPDPRVRQQFQIMNLHLILDLYPSLDEAMANFA